MKVKRVLVALLAVWTVGSGVSFAAGASVGAEALARTEPLLEALAAHEMLEIVREEGVGHAETLETEMFPGRGKDRWRQAVSDIYDVERMETMLLEGMAAGMEPASIDPLLVFFATDLGQRIVTLETGARRAMLDPSVEAAAREYLAVLQDDQAPRLDVLVEFALVNDLVDANVSTALNANFAFYTGLNDAGAFGEHRTENDLLREIWQQEPDIRLETEIWVMSYLALAYQPLTDDELQEYLDFTTTQESLHMNAQLFVAFDEIFRLISREMGMAAAGYMAGEDI